MNIPPRSIIHRDVFIFIYNLLKYIIYDEDKPIKLEQEIKEKRSKKINLFIGIANEKINQRIDKSSNDEKTNISTKELTTDYSKENFENIILFLKLQNPIYTGDILDFILIQICGFAMQIGPHDTTNEYICYNFNKTLIENLEQYNLEKVKSFINCNFSYGFHKCYGTKRLVA